jgi:hypothetical protein
MIELDEEEPEVHTLTALGAIVMILNHVINEPDDEKRAETALKIGGIIIEALRGMATMSLPPGHQAAILFHEDCPSGAFITIEAMSDREVEEGGLN